MSARTVDRDGGEVERPTGLARVPRAWRALPGDQRLAGAAALGLFGSMLLPWYEKSFFERGAVTKDTLHAFNVFSFVEAAVLLVAAGVLALLFARAERRAFHLPGGDGTVILAGGLWAGLLLVWRLFDKPEISGPAQGATVGVNWGIFVALAAAGALAYAGSRVRAAHRPEPPARRRDAGEGEADADGDERIVLSDQRPWLAETEPLPPSARRDRAQSGRPRTPSRTAEVPEPSDPPAPPDALR